MTDQVFPASELLVENARRFKLVRRTFIAPATQPTTLNMASSSTQSPAARQTTGTLPALSQPIADKVAWTQGGRTRKRTLNSRQAHDCKRRRHVMTSDIHWSDQSRPLNDWEPQTQRQMVPTSPTHCCPALQTEPTETNDQTAVTKQTSPECHHRASALHTIKCTLTVIAREDPNDTRRESARVLLEMMSDVSAELTSTEDLHSDSKIPCTYGSDSDSSEFSLPSTCASQATLQQTHESAPAPSA